MFLKIMSGEDAPDSDSRKMFKLFDHVSTAEFSRKPGKGVVAEVVFDDDTEESFDIPGNAYLMNAEGITVASVGSAPYRRAAA